MDWTDQPILDTDHTTIMSMPDQEVRLEKSMVKESITVTVSPKAKTAARPTEDQTLAKGTDLQARLEELRKRRKLLANEESRIRRQITTSSTKEQQSVGSSGRDSSPSPSEQRPPPPRKRRLDTHGDRAPAAKKTRTSRDKDGRAATKGKEQTPILPAEPFFINEKPLQPRQESPGSPTHHLIRLTPTIDKTSAPEAAISTTSDDDKPLVRQHKIRRPRIIETEESGSWVSEHTSPSAEEYSSPVTTEGSDSDSSSNSSQTQETHSRILADQPTTEANVNEEKTALDLTDNSGTECQSLLGCTPGHSGRPARNRKRTPNAPERWTIDDLRRRQAYPTQTPLTPGKQQASQRAR
jgi:hypothetical protein